VGQASGWRSWSWLAPAFVIYSLCRIPSFFEPHWYTDEAGYASTARAVLRGLPLYSVAWTNKPPLQIWAVAIPLWLFGPSEAGLHALTFISGLVALTAVAFVAGRLLSTPRAIGATVAFALAIGLPFVEAELIVPESLLIAPVTWAGALMVLRFARGEAAANDAATEKSGRKAVSLVLLAALAGALVGVGLGIQQTVLADAVVFALVIVLARRWSALAAYLLAMAAVVAAWILPAIAVAGAPAVSFALVGFYRTYAAFSVPSTPLGLGLRALGPPLALVGAVIARREGNRAWPLWLWACADLAVSAVANRPYPHFLIPALAPAVLAVASLPRPRVPWPVRRRLGTTAMVAAFLITGNFALVAGLDLSTVQAYAVWPASHVVKNVEPWSALPSLTSPGDEAVAKWIRDNGYSDSSAVVWSSSAWIYMLADLDVSLPAAPIYNDVIIYGSGRALALQVESMQPELIVTSDEATRQWPDIVPLLTREYQLVYSSGYDHVYVRG
jgi:4-amino-4-deoxy-L-arabinose transferase-like glycosyltransferase